MYNQKLSLTVSRTFLTCLLHSVQIRLKSVSRRTSRVYPLIVMLCAAPFLRSMDSQQSLQINESPRVVSGHSLVSSIKRFKSFEELVENNLATATPDLRTYIAVAMEYVKSSRWVETLITEDPEKAYTCMYEGMIKIANFITFNNNLKNKQELYELLIQLDKTVAIQIGDSNVSSLNDVLKALVIAAADHTLIPELPENMRLGFVPQTVQYLLGKMSSVLSNSSEVLAIPFCGEVVTRLLLDDSVDNVVKKNLVYFVSNNLAHLNIDDVRKLAQNGFPPSAWFDLSIKEVFKKGLIEHVQALIEGGVNADRLLACGCLRCAYHHIIDLVLRHKGTLTGMSLSFDDVNNDVVTAEKCLQRGARLVANNSLQWRLVLKYQKCHDSEHLESVLNAKNMELAFAAAKDDNQRLVALLKANYSQQKVTEALCYAVGQLATNSIDVLLAAGADPDPAFIAIQAIKCQECFEKLSEEDKEKACQIKLFLQKKLSLKKNILMLYRQKKYIDRSLTADFMDLPDGIRELLEPRIEDQVEACIAAHHGSILAALVKARETNYTEVIPRLVRGISDDHPILNNSSK